MAAATTTAARKYQLQQQQLRDINQFTSLPRIAVTSEQPSRNVFDETEENGIDQKNVG